MKVRLKLIVSFLFMIALAIIVGAVGIVGMYQINAADDALYNGNYLPSVLAGDISQTVVSQRVAIRNFIIYDVNNDAEHFNNTEKDLNELESKMKSLLEDYDGTIINQTDRDIFEDFKKTYEDEWLPVVNEIYNFGKNNQTQEAKNVLTSVSAADVVSHLDELSSELQQINMADGKTSVDGNTSLFITMTVVEAVALVVAILAAFLLAFYISGLISKPANLMNNFLQQIGKQGVVNFSEEEYRQANHFATAKDEIGQSLGMLVETCHRLEVVGKALDTVANGDLTTDTALLSDRDSMGLALQKMVKNLNGMFGEINASTTQVSAGSKQIADGSQALAQGSTQQAAAVEQLSSSITEIAQKTKDNAEMAGKAAELATTIKSSAEKGNTQMSEMMDAVRDINQASQSINKVIKVIDDIAFQTNILALNAAVEAARAGQHGKGFAVVAEEVRNLASKSSEAAKDTGSMIANSIEKAELGSRIAGETAASLAEIVSGINESGRLIEDIASSSEEQSLGIAQINKGIDQVAQVIQQNSATAEESAAASEEMSGQANMLEDLVGQFKLKDGTKGARKLSADYGKAPKKQLSMPSKTTAYAPNEDAGGYGKY